MEESELQQSFRESCCQIPPQKKSLIMTSSRERRCAGSCHGEQDETHAEQVLWALQGGVGTRCKPSRAVMSVSPAPDRALEEPKVPPGCDRDKRARATARRALDGKNKPNGIADRRLTWECRTVVGAQVSAARPNCLRGAVG